MKEIQNRSANKKKYIFIKYSAFSAPKQTRKRKMTPKPEQATPQGCSSCPRCTGQVENAFLKEMRHK